jgi:hypothetical protein
MQEIWKDIQGYEGLYQVSNLGRVKRVSGKILKPENLNKKSYLRVRLYKNKIGKHHLIHRIVAEAFVPNLRNAEEVNHKNGDKQDNKVTNLEWITHKENMQHAFKNGLAGGEHFRNNKGSKPVAQYTEKMELIAVYPSRHEAERKTGIYQGRISRSVQSGCKAGGFFWKNAT